MLCQSLVESTIGKDVLRRGVWTPNKPNQITLELQNGLKVFDNGTIKDGPPTVKASQNFTQYRWDATKNPVSKIEVEGWTSWMPWVWTNPSQCINTMLTLLANQALDWDTFLANCELCFV